MRQPLNAKQLVEILLKYPYKSYNVFIHVDTSMEGSFWIQYTSNGSQCLNRFEYFMTEEEYALEYNKFDPGPSNLLELKRVLNNEK